VWPGAGLLRALIGCEVASGARCCALIGLSSSWSSSEEEEEEEEEELMESGSSFSRFLSAPEEDKSLH